MPKTKLGAFIKDSGLNAVAIVDRMGSRRDGIGYSSGWLSAIVNGRSRIYADDAVRLARTLSLMTGRQVTVDEIVGPIHSQRAAAVAQAKGTR